MEKSQKMFMVGIIVLGIIIALLLGMGFNFSTPVMVPPVTTDQTLPPPVSNNPETSIEPNIVVTKPAENQTIGSTIEIEGSARVFENVVLYRLLDAENNILLEGNTMSSAPDIGQFGEFKVSATYKIPQTKEGTLEVFTDSPKDGSEIDKITRKVIFK